MYVSRLIIGAVCTTALAQAYDQLLGFDDKVEVENRTIDEIHQAALAEGGVVTCWYGGDAPNQQAGLKKAFEEQFPGMTLNITADASKYLGVRLDRLLASNDVYVDSIIDQSVQDFPRWAEQGALLQYKPLGFENVIPAYRDARGAYNAFIVRGYGLVWNAEKTDSVITEFSDFLKPEFKDKIILTYPNDDDSILFVFDLILKEFGLEWFEALLAQNPTWVRGTQTPADIIAQSNSSYVATFTTLLGSPPPAPFNISYPTIGQFMSWSHLGAILKDAPHPEGAKLFHAFQLMSDYQSTTPIVSIDRANTFPNQPFEPTNSSNTDPIAFDAFMSDRARVERLRFWFEDRLGLPQGGNPAIYAV